MKKTDDLASAPEMSEAFIRTWLMLLMIAAAYIRVHGVGEYYYSHDEMLHIDIAKGRTLGEVLQFSRYETHPPLFYLLLHYWLMLSGNPAFVRGFSLLPGLALIPLYYRIGKKLNGELTGLCAAALIAFSIGLIIQSYAVRQYSLFVFLLSACFYSYLHWHNRQTPAALASYAVFGGLACLTHFSGVFAILSMASAEAISMYIRKTAWRQQSAWASVNFILGIISLGVFYLWQPAVADFQQQNVRILHTEPLSALLAGAWLYPFHVFDYIFPRAEAALLCAFLLPLGVYYSICKREYFFILPWAALGLSMALCASAVYPYIGRHALWLTPFVIAYTAWLLADIFFLIHESYLKKDVPWQQITAYALLAAGMLAYDPGIRFSDKSEYLLRKSEWRDLTQYINSLDATHLVISERGEAFLLALRGHNPYLSISEENGPHASEPSATVIIPLSHARLMFRKFYMHYDNNSFIRMMEDARQNGTLNGVDTLVFMRVSSSRTALLNLLRCPALEKKIIAFPPAGPEHTLTDHDILTRPVTLLEVSKKIFFEQVISPNGKARSCLQQAVN